MTLTNFPQKVEKFEIQAYKKKPADLTELKRTHVPFTGSPLRHPDDPDKVILVADPYSSNTFYYEFRNTDISYIEELPSIVNLDNETISISRIWVKKKSVGVRCSPFLVEDIRM